uniref:Serine/threonine protein phosphatase 2C n=1 Tax=Mycena chlorophos TaxID=658473 RepID=A0ABQ0LBD0_MYCCL|nr:serine/threonine protein phosphatase 2C [Mycena chlorophos]
MGELNFKTRQSGAFHIASLPTKGEDCAVVVPFDHGTVIAIFDGHCGSELAEYASQVLPPLVAEAFNGCNDDLEANITAIFAEFDQSLLSLSPTIHSILGYSGQEKFATGRLSVVGTTALIGFINQAQDEIWVISLGDSYVVRGRDSDGEMFTQIMSDAHSASNPVEVQRVAEEHPDENDIIKDNQGPRVRGYLAVTRALGDHQLKTDLVFAKNIRASYYPSPVPMDAFDENSIFKLVTCSSSLRTDSWIP